jgi:dipeptidyl aminopeptidase/acylaminoacyl peptidase
MGLVMQARIGAAIAAVAVMFAAANADDLIPRRVFFGSAKVGGVNISPDGKSLCYAAPVDGVMNLWLAPVADVAAGKPLTHDKRGLWNCWWSPDSRYVLYFQDKTGAENNQLHAIDAATGTDRDLTNAPKAQAKLVTDSHAVPNEVLITLNDRDGRWPDVYRINLDTGTRQLVYRNSAYTSFVASDDLRVRYATAPTSDGGNRIVRFNADGTETPFLAVPAEDALTTNLIGMDRSGRTLYAVSSLGRERAALVELDPADGKERLLGSDGKADISGWPLAFHPESGRLEAYSVNYLVPEWKVVDRAVAADFAFLGKRLAGRWNIASRSGDNGVWVLYHDPIKASPRYWLYDRKARTLKELFVSQPELAGRTLAPMRGLTFRARDGLEIPVYLTLPAGADKNGDGKPDNGPLPMVILVHGGPWAREDYSYNSEHQWLANRGYAVLTVNFRGSTGFGKRFGNAGDRQWGLAMENDLIDAKRWAVARGIAKPDKVALRGFSYGGYAVLAGLSMYPGEFACGVDQAGPANLQTLLESVPPFLQSLIDMLHKRVGDWKSPEGKAALKAVSPLTHADRITAPLLIVQGANDPRVPKAEADAMAAALQRNGRPVVYLAYPDEGHGLVRSENFLSFTAVTEAFLAAALGGAYQPIGDDMTGASVEVVTGADRVPGLETKTPAVLH